MAFSPMKLLAITPSMTELMLPIATKRICTGSRLKNSLVIMSEFFFIITYFPLPFGTCIIRR